MDLKKPLSEAAQESIEETLRKEHPYLEPTALADITEQCRQTILGEQIREFVARRLREEHQWLKQDVLEQLAQKCKETLSIRLTAEYD